MLQGRLHTRGITASHQAQEEIVILGFGEKMEYR